MSAQCGRCRGFGHWILSHEEKTQMHCVAPAVKHVEREKQRGPHTLHSVIQSEWEARPQWLTRSILLANDPEPPVPPAAHFLPLAMLHAGIAGTLVYGVVIINSQFVPDIRMVWREVGFPAAHQLPSRRKYFY